VYVIQGGHYEKRPVQIGVADFFYAEVQQGLSSGEVVALELPKNVQNEPKKTAPAAGPGGKESPGGKRSATADRSPAGGSRTTADTSGSGRLKARESSPRT
jgi:hypothetical protein